ncbi:MAG: nuclear transport factor 2 family protein [Chloroflexota bacterium]|nr:nuclear transport factor 2 family protein [Chloroflexota bacterium]
MSNSLAEPFMRALQASEEAMDPAPVVALFTDSSELSNLSSQEPQRGIDGAQTFWQNYLAVFQQIHSNFHHVIETDNAAVMEWISDGTLKNGEPIRYKGVSIIETEGDKVTRFSTYYDSGAFLPQGAKQRPG